VERIKEAVMRARAQREENADKDGREDKVEQAAGQAVAVGQPAQKLEEAASPVPATTAGAQEAQETQEAQAGQGGQLQTSAGAGVVAAVADTAVASIKYKQTRVVHLDPSQLERNRIISFSKSDVRTVAFDRLRTQVLRTMRDYGWRTLAITSPTAGCGKTTVALNLAFSIAHQTEQTVLLADFDLRDPQVAEYLGLPESASLVDYLNGDVPISEVFVNPGIPRLTLLPNHKAVLNAAETLMTRKLQNMVSDIRDRYESRMVIFDLPPLLTTDDALAFLPQVDCVLLVVASGQSTKSEVRTALNLLQDTEVLGSVLNKAEEVGVV